MRLSCSSSASHIGARSTGDCEDLPLRQSATIEINPIKSDRDCRRALKEIDRLMDARLNTEDGDRLDVLTSRVEAWEEAHHAIDAPPELGR